MTFQAGTSGNPNGRPKGSGNRQQIFDHLVAPHAEELINLAIKKALNGNEVMLRLFLERILPAKPHGEPIHIDVPAGNFNSTEVINQVGLEAMRAVTAGEITPEEAVRVASVLKAHQGTYQLIELREELHLLLERIEKGSPHQ